MILTLSITASAFLALLLIALWALQGMGRPVDARIRALALARQQGEDLASIPFRHRIITPFIEAIGRRVVSVLPGSYSNRIERRLVLAGEPMRPVTFYALVFAIGILLAGVYVLLLLVMFDTSPPAPALLMTAFIGALGAYLPIFWLSSQASARKMAMVKGLPDSLDLLTICVEAGLGLDQAFQRVTENQSGPFIYEVRQMLREISVGKTRRQALRDLAERTDIDDVRSFATAVIQAEQLGTSLARVLRVQSQRLRVRRRQRAEQEARRAPVKMVFPLVFCLMPSLFIFILGPIIVLAAEFLSS